MRRRLAHLARPLRYADLRRVWAAQALSELGDWATVVALAVLVFDRTGSGALTAAVFAVSLLPAVGLGPLLATIGDRRPRRTVMLVTDLVRGCLTLAMVIPMPTGFLLGLLFLSSLAGAPFRAARSAIIPELTPPEIYHDSLVLRTVTEQAAVLAGYAGGGLLVAAIGVRGALLVDACSFFASAALLRALRIGRTIATPADRVPTTRAGLAAALRWLVADELVRSAALFGCCIAGCGMVVEATTVVYATDALDRGSSTAGVLAAAIPVGSIVGALVPFDVTAPAPLRRIGLLAVAGSAVAFVVFAAEAPMPLVLVGFFGVGTAFSSIVMVNTIFGTRIPTAIAATAFGLLGALFTACESLGAVLGGLGAGWFGIVPTCTAAVAFSGFLGITAVATRRNRPARPVVEVAARDL